MKLKYYLRGLGIGIAVTAIVCMAGGKPAARELSDSEIILRAKALGMTEASASVSEKQSETPSESKIPAGPDTPAGTGTTGGSETPAGDRPDTQAPQKPDSTESQKPDNTASQKPGDASSQKPDSSLSQKPDSGAAGKPEVTSKKIYTVTVFPGEGSYTVSRKLAELGLVESADLYDRYLCQNDYDNRLCTGNYNIPEGSTPLEIARILTGK